MTKIFNYKNIKTLFSFLIVPFTHPFASKNIFKAFIRIIRWQILSRQKTEIIETWVNDLKVICKNGDTGFTGNLYYGLMEYHDMSFVMHLLDSNDTFVDIGSNLGSYTLLVGGVCKSITYSLEPSPTTFKRLIKNVEINNLDNIQCLNIGAGDENGSFYMTDDKGPENHLIIDNKTYRSNIKVEVQKVDDINFKSKPTFMKIDTEGCEYQVIKGAMNILESSEMIGLLVEINGNNERFNGTNHEIVNLLKKMGYMPYRFDHIKNDLNKIEYVNSKGNTLFIKNYDLALNKIKSYKGSTIWGMSI